MSAQSIADLGSGSEIPSLSPGHIFVGNAFSVATDRALSGDATLSDSGVLTFNDTAVTPNIYGSATQVGRFTVNSKGLITSASNITITPAWSNITGKPTTLAGFGITDGVTSVSFSTGSTGLTGNATITSTGTITLGGVLNIASGGTGQSTANNALNALLPSQTSNSGKALVTDGTNTSWSNILPSQTGNNGKFLKTNGTTTSWFDIVIPTGGGYQ